METKNEIVVNSAKALFDAAGFIANIADTLNANINVNIATIKTINALIENVRSLTVILQQNIDDYMEG